MAKKIYSAIVALVSIIMTVVVVSSCTTEEIDNNLSKKSTNTEVVKGTNFTNSLTHDVDEYGADASDNMTASTLAEVLEDAVVVDSYTLHANPLMEAHLSLSQKDYYISESDVECTVTSQTILREQETSELTDGGVAVSDTAVFYISDGQVVKVASTITSYTGSYNEKTFNFGSLKLKDAEILSIENVAAGATRASYVSASYQTTYTVAMSYEEINTSKDTTIVVTLYDTAIRRVLSEDDIDSVEVANKTRVVVDDNTEKCSFDKVITMKSGEVTTMSKSIVLNRLFKGIEAYDKYVTSFGFGLASVNGQTTGAEASVSTSDNWSVYGRTDSYGAAISNGIAADAFATSYTLYHERATYADENVEVVFGYEDITVSEVTNTVSEISSTKSGYDAARYDNGIRTVYIGYTQNLSEYVNLYKAQPEEVKVTGYEIRDGKLVINTNNVVASLTFVTIYSDGSEETESVSKTISRSLTCTSNWTAYEDNADAFTHMLSISLTGSSAKSDSYWTWTEETRSITTTATLNGSTQNNSWTAVTPNNIVYTRQGKTYNFGSIAFDAVESDNVVTLSSETDEATTYSYSGPITVTFGDNVTESSAPGTIVVAKAIDGDFPAEWGKFVSATATLSCNEDKSDWVYAWSIHFENGTLPVVVGKNASSAVIDQSLFDYDTNNKLNGAVYSGGSWMNAIASDKAHYMMWTDTDAQAKNALIYEDATIMGWYNGNNTVFQTDFAFTISNDGKTLTVTKNGNAFATYTATVR